MNWGFIFTFVRYGPKPDSKNTTYNKGKVLLEIKNLNMEISEASDKVFFKINFT